MRRLILGALTVALGLAACGAPAAPSNQNPAGCTPAPGVTCFGTANYVEYVGGDLPIVISVPHGGALVPATIPDRSGTTVTDTNTIELGRAIALALQTRTGRPVHLVISHLRRTKLDANREVIEAAQGSAAAAQAWAEYHGFIETAARDVVLRSGRGIYIDLHGHGHTKQRLELGYLLTGATLDLTDAQLDAQGIASQSSLRLAMMFTSASFSQVLRGPTSLGARLLPQVASVPSPADPSPGSDPFFEGGYSTARHTAILPGLQIESHFAGIRDSAGSRADFAAVLADALLAFIRDHLGLQNKLPTRRVRRKKR